MAECEVCGKQTSMPFTCKFCEASFCSTHRLPENHDCQGLENYTEQSREEGKVGYDVIKTDQPESSTSGDATNTYLEARSNAAVNTYNALRRQLSSLNMTYILLGVLFAVYFLQESVSGFTQAFVLEPALALQEPWRLFTAMFLHGSLGHLLVNSIVLFSFGTQIERMLGTEKFLEVLLVAGMASFIGFAISGYAFGMGPALGLSGGLYGLVTLLAVLRPDVRVLAFFVIPLKIRTAVKFFGTLDFINFVAHGFGVMLPVIGGFASAGHLSGLVVGLLYGYRLKDRYRPPKQIAPPFQNVFHHRP